MRDGLVMGRDGQQGDPSGGSEVTRAPTKRVTRGKKGEGRGGGKGASRCSGCRSPKSALCFLGTTEKGSPAPCFAWGIRTVLLTDNSHSR